MVLPSKARSLTMGNADGTIERSENTHVCASSRETTVTFDRRVKIVDETECLHKLGFSKELRGEAKSPREIEQARALLPDAFGDFATGKRSGKATDVVALPCVAEMAVSGSLKTLFESRTGPDVKHIPSAASSTPVVFVPPSYFKVDGTFDS